MFGSVTCQNVCQPLAPSDKAASSSVVPCSCMSGINSLATNGKVTNMVASTIPGTAKRISMPCDFSHGPSADCELNNNTYTRPEMTGDTENGRSINVVRKALPLNSNLAIAHAATTPKT